MTNRDIEAAWTYHNGTKHSYWSVRNDAHALDWANEPLPFKIYPALAPIPLPREFPRTDAPALWAIAQTGTLPAGEVLPDLPHLAALLFFSAGITKRRTFGGREIFYRAAACTGALYEIELYLVCGDLPELPAGVYHFGPGDFALRRLRSGDHRGVLVRATGADSAVASAVGRTPLTIICTGTYWRNAWKYRARTYRHFGWDNGTILANLLAMCAALALPARVEAGFVDSQINELLDVDPRREVAFSLVPIGHTNAPLPESSQDHSSLGLETVPLSRAEVDYPAMRAMHEASSLFSAEEAAEWSRSAGAAKPRQGIRGDCARLAPLAEDAIPRQPVSEVILRRGSTREFARVSISFEQLSTLLERATRGIPADFPPLNDLYLIVNAVDGLPAGAYFFHREGLVLERLKEGNFRGEAGYLGLEQQIPADASVAVFFLADLRDILERFGNRGYRAVQLEAGILGGKLYLAAYAQGLGASGLTFYDDDVVEFFSPHAKGKSAIFLMAVGVSAISRGKRK